jgi:hypothetical protein
MAFLSVAPQTIPELSKISRCSVIRYSAFLS